jgi:hypothetical protein
MSGDEDEAGAVHDDAGEHSDEPGGVGEAGVVHALMHSWDILRAVQQGRQAAKWGGGMRRTCAGVYPRWHGEMEGATRGHARWVGQRVARSKTGQWPRFVWWPVWELMSTRKLHVFPESAGSTTLSLRT